MRRSLKIFDLTHFQIDYVSAWKWQKVLMEHLNSSRINSQTVDYLLLIQHKDVYTLGRGATVDNIKAHDVNIPIHRAERGGEVTWHGPGQLVAYPIIDLEQHKKDLHWYVRLLESSVISSLHEIGIESTTSPINTGVWVGNKKICAIGISASRWITMHGLSLNIDCSLQNYENIIPCGISSSVGGVCSASSILNRPVSFHSTKSILVKHLQEKFNMSCIEYYNDDKILFELLFNYPKIAEVKLPDV
jgi:lipoyl(octanoyl) transferase